MEATLDIKKKNLNIFLKKPPEFYQKFYEVLFFYVNFQKFKQFLWNFSTKQRIFLLFLGNLKKTQGIFQKTQGIEKKLNVMEAKCLRLPPKNRAKNSPGLKLISQNNPTLCACAVFMY